MGDILVNATALVRGSGATLALGTFMTATGIVGLALGDRLGSALVLVFGVLFLSGLLLVPFVWWSIRQRRELVLAPITIEADTEGLTVSASFATSKQSWTMYRRARETSRGFLLDIGTGASVMIAKRGIAGADILAFRELLRRAGLLTTASLARRLRPLVWIAVGLLATVAVFQGPRLIAGVNATATRDLQAHAGSGTVTVMGTTSLPDGSTIVVDVIQLDEWEQETADGTQPAYDSPWEIYRDVIVQDGKFSEVFQIADWPTGRGLASAYFWMDSSQPQAAIDRFGLDGQDLRGPDVVEDPDYGPLLQVEQPFEIP
jgi:YcxB-like protein